MRLATTFLAACVLSACAGSPPKPVQPEGEYRPINRPQAIAPQSVGIRFVYEGDISGALDALHSVSPTFKALPAQGMPKPVFVRVNLTGVSLETALKAIGTQGGDIAEVVFQTTKHGDAQQAFIRYKG